MSTVTTAEEYKWCPKSCKKVDADENDTQMLMRELEQINEIEDDWSDSQVLDVLQRIEGPYSIVFWQASTSRLWFARDCLGRRSLLWHKPTGDEDGFYLSSVSSTIETGFWEEVPANGIYCIHIDKLIQASGISKVCMHYVVLHCNNLRSHPSVQKQMPTTYATIAIE